MFGSLQGGRNERVGQGEQGDQSERGKQVPRLCDRCRYGWSRCKWERVSICDLGKQHAGIGHHLQTRRPKRTHRKRRGTFDSVRGARFVQVLRLYARYRFGWSDVGVNGGAYAVAAGNIPAFQD